MIKVPVPQKVFISRIINIPPYIQPPSLTNHVKKYPYLFPTREKMIQKGLEKEVREKETTFPQKVFLSRINIS